MFIKKFKYVVSSEWYGNRVSGRGIALSLVSTTYRTLTLWNNPNHYEATKNFM
jgi:hypothetical protein